MSKKTKRMRQETYWREKNYEKVYERYQNYNQIRNLKDTLRTKEEVANFMNNYDYNKLIDINKPLSEKEIYSFADQFSRGDYQIMYNKQPRHTPSIKQAQYVVNAAKELGINMTVQDVIDNPDLYYEVRDAYQLTLGTNDLEIIGYFMFGS